jgi:GNAT superfamily N-acetyltransferase
MIDGVELVTSTSPNGYIRLSLIRVAPEFRGRGLAKQAMQELLAKADAEGRVITLTPEPLAGDRTTSKRRLEAWYASLGFVRNAGRHRDCEITDSWYRLPREET